MENPVFYQFLAQKEAILARKALIFAFPERPQVLQFGILKLGMHEPHASGYRAFGPTAGVCRCRVRMKAMSETLSLEAQVNQQVILAMKAHDAVRTTTLRLIKNALKNKFIEKREALTPAEEQQALATMIKQRRDSIDQFTKGNRPELAAAEATEIVVIEEFLPKALDEAALAALVAEAVAEVAAAIGHAPTSKEMGAVMKAVQAKLQAASHRAEGRTVSEMVKKALAG